MFNNTNGIIFLAEDQELYKHIIRSINTAKSVMEDYIGKRPNNPSEVTSSGKNPLNRGTIFKFLDNHLSFKNKSIFNKDWVEAVFKISKKGEKDKEIYRMCSYNGRDHALCNVFRGHLRKDAYLLLHILWCRRAILLPFGFNLPVGQDPKIKSKNSGNNYEYAASTYPELLAISRQPYINHIDFGLPQIAKLLPNKTLKNFGWYFRAFIRSSTWWRVEDISTEDIIDILLCDMAKAPSYKSIFSSLRGWLVHFKELFPERCKFDIDKTLPEAKNIYGDNYIPDDIREKISVWKRYMDMWEKKLIRKGEISAGKKRVIINKLITYFVSFLYPKTGAKNIPLPKEFTRKYLDGPDDHVENHELCLGFLDYLKTGIELSTYQTYLYTFDSFFSYLEFYQDENGFKKHFSLDFDAPVVHARGLTNKKIFPIEQYPHMISYLYGLSDWVWFMINQANEEIGQEYLTKYEADGERRYWNTEDSGFVPIFWMDGKAIPIRAIPYSIAPISYRFFKNRSAKTRYKIVDPHYIHLTTLIYETGIRLKHANWLDIRSYDKDVDRDQFNPYSFDISKIYINTDKSHGPWSGHTSQAVIGILDRQKFYQNMIEGEGSETLINYSNLENSTYEKIQCLFFKGCALNSSKTPNLSPISDTAIRAAFKKIIYSFNTILLRETNCKPFCDISFLESMISEDYDIFFSHAYNRDTIKLFNTDITPHSARAQVVSTHILILPPWIIKLITGHSNDKVVSYYAKIDTRHLKMINEKSSELFFSDEQVYQNSPVKIQANSINSKLRKAFDKNRQTTLSDFGATSFTDTKKSGASISGMIEIIRAPSDKIAFNSTHICPFNNQCPSEIIKDLNASETQKPCGNCYYSVKTVDHLPRILSTVRELTDESAEISKHIKHLKENNASSDIITIYANRRKFVSNEIVGWSITIQLLENMASTLKSRNKWLIQKPELLSEHILKVNTSKSELSQLILRVEEASNYADLFTPSLKSKVKIAQSKLLAFTPEFQKSINNIPDDYTLLDQFRGQLRAICDVMNISMSDIAKYLEPPLKPIPLANQPFALITNCKKEINNATRS